MFLLAQAATQTPPGGNQTQWLVWGLVLLAVAVALFFVEAFLPTGGIIGAASGLAAVSGVVCLFWRDSTLGLVAATGVILAMPFAIAFALKVAPDTPFAKWVTLKDDQEPLNNQNMRQPNPAAEGESSRDQRPRLKVGDTGKTLTPLFPVGTCLIHGRREECLAQRGVIEKGVNVRVVAVDGNEVSVAVDDRQD